MSVNGLNLSIYNSYELLNFAYSYFLCPCVWDKRVGIADLEFTEDEHSGNSIVHYTGRIIGRDRSVVASDPFPLWVNNGGYITYPLHGCTRLKWKKESASSSFVPLLHVSHICYYEVIMHAPKIVNTSPIQRLNEECVAVGLCILPHILLDELPGVYIDMYNIYVCILLDELPGV